MQYTGSDCPVCSNKFGADDDIVVCPVCGTPHHRDCWRANGGCKNEDKHKDGFVWINPASGVALPDLKGPADADKNASGKLSEGNVKICPRCGEANAPFEPVCTRCGERLKANRKTIDDSMPDFNKRPFYGYGENPNPNNFSPYQNVYAADAKMLYGADTTIDGIPVSEVAEYVQKKSNKYVGDFLEMQEKKTKLKWNWSAAVFSVFWFFYRKMTAFGFAVIAILFSVNLMSSFVTFTVYEKYRPEVYEEYSEDLQELNDMISEVRSSGMQAFPDNYESVMLKILFSPIMLTTYIIQLGVYLLLAVISGFFGTYFYKKKVIKDINTLRKIAVDSMSYHIYIAQRGGISNANVLLPILCYMILNTISSYL